MKTYLIICVLISNVAAAQESEDFRGLLKGLIQKDPIFQEIDLQTTLYEAQLYQGFSQLALPKLSLSYGEYWQNTTESFFAEDNYRVGSLTASLSLFSFGSDWKNFQSTRFERKAQDQRVLARLQEREQIVAGLVLNYIREERNLDILKKIVGLKEKALEVSRQRYDRGALSREDFSKVKLDVSNARGELLLTAQNLNLARAQVKAYGTESLPVTYPWESALTESKLKTLQNLTTPVRELPQYKAFELMEMASEQRREASRNIMLGKFQLNFSRSMYDLEKVDQWEWRTSLVYTLPLFDSFNEYVQYKRNDVQERYNTVRRKFENDASASVQVSEKENLQISWKNWAERREALTISSRLYTGSLSQFNQGKLTVNELLVDQDRLLRTELIANLALHQLHTSVLSFCHSQGLTYVKGCF